jgi:hypothetical protein
MANKLNISDDEIPLDYDEDISDTKSDTKIDTNDNKTERETGNETETEIEHENNNENKIVIELQLGDIIKIIDPKNEILNEQTFIIDYIDSSKVKLINADTLETKQLQIDSNQILGDGTITTIFLLSRNEFPGYAKQNGLLPNTWVNIYFEEEVPYTITGKITNLEEDMIELQLYPDNDVFYINFDYKGLPEDLPIKMIEIREKPEKIKVSEIEVEPEAEEKLGEIPDLEKEGKKIQTEKINMIAPIENVKSHLKEIILKADQIKFGKEEFGKIVQYIDVNVKSQRYSIETQVNDLLDELLSTIPTAQRTAKVLNNVHLVIERFKQLRTHFSSFDEYGNVNGSLIYASDYKPLEQYYKSFDKNLYWILPVIKNIKKIYNIDNGENDEHDENDDILNSGETFENSSNMEQIIEKYKSNDLTDDENKYSSLYNQLNPYFTPFNYLDPENTHDLLIVSKVSNNINTIVDNLDNLYSSVFSKNNIRSRKFITQQYNTGLTKLEVTSSSSSRMITKLVNLTEPDVMYIKSFLTLPEPVIRFSRINLPGSSILDRATLAEHFINYWQLLKKQTNVNDVVVESLNKEIEYDETNFVNNIKNFILTIDNEEIKGMTKNEIYDQFINTIIPKTKVLFNLIKKYITGKISIVDIVGYLEPFLIYTDNLTYMQYKDITQFIFEKISEFNKKFSERSKVFGNLKRLSNERRATSYLFSLINLLQTNNDIRGNVLDLYDYHDTKGDLFVNSELLRKLMIKDNSKLYNSAISIENVPLMFPSEFTHIFDDEKKDIDSKIKGEESEKNCNNIVISKFYKNEEELKIDNEVEIYFDKKYDTTNYSLLDSYEKELFAMNPENFITFLNDKLMSKLKISTEDADYLTDTLINGHKKVLNGQYSILYLGTKPVGSELKETVNYYIRKNNKWELDSSIDKASSSDDSNILCNLQQKCISAPNKTDNNEICESVEVNELQLQNNLLKEIINEFDEKYTISKQDFENKINEQYQYNMKIMPILTQIQTENFLKYNNQKYSIIINTDDEKQIVISPYSKLRNLIMGQEDFVKKQTDIIRFVMNFTRPYYANKLGPLGEQESEHWLYCIKTDIQLIPAFIYDMACAFLNTPDQYNDHIDTLIKKIGTISDDGDSWVDKNTGYVIKRTDFDVEEGYEDGFKITTRAVLNKDISITLNKSNEHETPEIKMITNIVNALSVSMGINIESQKEFIINGVTETLRKALPTESEHKTKVKELANKGKIIPSFEHLYDASVLYYTFGMFLISVQTIIPSIRTRKTFPGCVRSFRGYPFEGAGDVSSLNYLVCVAYNMRSPSAPWYTLSKTKQESISNKIKASIDEHLLGLSEVKRKIDEKTEYLLINNEIDIPIQHNIVNWRQFLPSLFPLKITNLLNISPEFESKLLTELKNGSPNQREKILIIQYKIIQFSLAIQEKIQNIVKKKQLLLTRSNNEPYLENACCNETSGQSTIQYFTNIDGQITEYNDIVNKLTNIMFDIIHYSKPILLYSNINTKNIYPSLSQEFSEETIYISFINFCHFNSLIPIDEDLIPLCIDKPKLHDNNSITEIITRLKSEGRNYSNENFLRLLQLINRKNIVHINIDSQLVSSINKLTGVLEFIDDQNGENEVVEPSLRKLITNALDTFDIATENVTAETKDLNNFLIKNILKMKTDIIGFININKNSTTSKNTLKHMENTINNISEWESNKSTRNIDTKISNDSLYNIVNFFKTFIKNTIDIFPNIILNQVDYNKVSIPSYWGLSGKHSNDIKKIIGESYDKLKVFYKDQSLYTILTKSQQTAKNIVLLSNVTPAFTLIKKKDKILKSVFDERTSKFLFEYYLLRVFINYIDLTDDDEMIVTEIAKKTELDNVFTTDYLDELETREDIDISNRGKNDIVLIKGNKKMLKQKVANLLLVFIQIIEEHKTIANISYEDILDKVFKTKEREKDTITDRLKHMTDEERNADTILKINKLGVWSKGLQKGLTSYVKETYDEEREFMEQMMQYEKNVNTNNNKTGENINVDDFIEQQEIDNEIEKEAYDMNGYTEDYENGNFEGDEVENYDDYN